MARGWGLARLQRVEVGVTAAAPGRRTRRRRRFPVEEPAHRSCLPEAPDGTVRGLGDAGPRPVPLVGRPAIPPDVRPAILPDAGPAARASNLCLLFASLWFGVPAGGAAPA